MNLHLFHFVCLCSLFSTYNLSYSAEAEELDSIKVLGQANSKLSPYDFIGSHDVINLNTYKNQFYNLTNILKEQAGLDLESISGIGQYSTPLIRGSEAQQVLVFVDGSPLNLLSGGSGNIGKVNTNRAQEIHIYKNFVPMELSPTSIGGAINVITDKNEDQQGSIKQTFGMYGVTSTQINQSIKESNTYVNLSFLKQSAENDFVYKEQQPVNSPSTPKFESRYNNGTSTTEFHIQAKHKFKDASRMEVHLNKLDYYREIAGLINTDLNKTNIDESKNSLKLRYKSEENSSSKMDLQYYLIDSKEIYDDLGSQIGLGIQYNQYNSLLHKLNLTNSFKIDSQVLTLNQQVQTESYGIKYLNNKLSDTKECYLNSQCDREYTRNQYSSGIRLQTEHTNNLDSNIQLVAIYNQDQPINENKDHSNSHVYWSVFSGLKYNHNLNHSFFININQQIRIPTTSELFGDRGSSIGNPDLKPESSLGGEIGYHYQNYAFTTSLAIYNRIVKNQIYKEQDSRGIIQYENYGKSELSGIELKFDTDFTQNIFFQGNVSYQVSKLIEGKTSIFIGNELPGHRTWFSNQSIYFSKNNFLLSFTSNYQSGGFYNSRNSEKKPDSLQFNMQINYTRNESSLNLGIFNLTNENTRIYPLTPVSGTTAYLTFRHQWSL